MGFIIQSSNQLIGMPQFLFNGMDSQPVIISNNTTSQQQQPYFIQIPQGTNNNPNDLGDVSSNQTNTIKNEKIDIDESNQQSQHQQLPQMMTTNNQQQQILLQQSNFVQQPPSSGGQQQQQQFICVQPDGTILFQTVQQPQPVNVEQHAPILVNSDGKIAITPYGEGRKVIQKKSRTIKLRDIRNKPTKKTKTTAIQQKTV